MLYSGINRKIRVVVPTVYKPECPTIRSRLLPLCRELTAKGFCFEFLVQGQGYSEVAPGVVFRGYRTYRELVRLIISVSKRDTDILLPCKAYSITGLLSLLTARVKGLGYVLDVDDRTFPSEINKFWRLPLYLQEWLSERLLMWIKPSTIVASRGLADYWGGHVSYLPNSADLTFFNRSNWNPHMIRERHGLRGPVLVWPAVFFQETDRRYVLDILFSLQRKKSSVSLLVLGEGDYLPHLKVRAEELGLSNIFFAGSVDYSEMPHYYASATAGMLPLRNNHYDACKGPIKLFEYMAMELPVIATNIGEAREIIPKAGCGILIPFEEPEVAADMIDSLVFSGERLHSLGMNGRRFLEASQSFARHADQLGRILNGSLQHLIKR